MKILLIEDDASIIRFLSLSLEKNGYKVIEARNGIEGISLSDIQQKTLGNLRCLQWGNRFR